MMVWDLLQAYQKSSLLLAGMEIGIFTALGQGPRSARQLAEELGLALAVLERLIPAFVCLGVLQGNSAEVSLSESGRDLLSPALQAWARLTAREYQAAWAHLGEGLRRGESPFQLAFGESPWEHRQRLPELQEAFTLATQSQLQQVARRLLRHYRFPGQAVVADLGGGPGTLLRALLEHYPDMRGVLYDRSVGGEPCERLQLVQGDLLAGVPRADIYLLKHVLHNWSDEPCLTILGHCRQSMGQNSRLLILEHLLSEQPPWEHRRMDLHMLIMHGGQERSREEFEALLSRVGLRCLGCQALGAGLPDLLEAAI